MMTGELAYLTASELSARFCARTLSPVDVTQHVLARIETLEPRLNAFVLVDGERALAAARASEERWLRGAALSAMHLVRSAGSGDVAGSRRAPARAGRSRDPGIRTPGRGAQRARLSASGVRSAGVGATAVGDRRPGIRDDGFAARRPGADLELGAEVAGDPCSSGRSRLVRCTVAQRISRARRVPMAHPRVLELQRARRARARHRALDGLVGERSRAPARTTQAERSVHQRVQSQGASAWSVTQLCGVRLTVWDR